MKKYCYGLCIILCMSNLSNSQIAEKLQGIRTSLQQLTKALKSQPIPSVIEGQIILYFYIKGLNTKGWFFVGQLNRQQSESELLKTFNTVKNEFTTRFKNEKAPFIIENEPIDEETIQITKVNQRFFSIMQPIFPIGPQFQVHLIEGAMPQNKLVGITKIGLKLFEKTPQGKLNLLQDTIVWQAEKREEAPSEEITADVIVSLHLKDQQADGWFAVARNPEQGTREELIEEFSQFKDQIIKKFKNFTQPFVIGNKIISADISEISPDKQLLPILQDIKQMKATKFQLRLTSGTAPRGPQVRITEIAIEAYETAPNRAILKNRDVIWKATAPLQGLGGRKR
jgi:hypothetical protein